MGSGADYAWYLLALIPIISGVIGWGTNVIAVKMLFYPTEFVGVKPFGWRGIVPANSVTLARNMYRLINTKLLTFKELFDDNSVAAMMAEQEPKIRESTRRIVTEQAEKNFKPMWENLGEQAREQVFDLAYSEVRQVSEVLAKDIIEDVESYIDIEPVVINSAKKNAALMGQIFSEVGASEFK
ncbi:MAG: hypothetical protein KC561_05600, partial [Myxococcales bacterium]|nr:hypothetical protein [Myxococcales bacterium]